MGAEKGALHRHLLVQEHPQQQRERVPGQKIVGLGLEGEREWVHVIQGQRRVDNAGHAQTRPRPVNSGARVCRVAGRTPRGTP